MGLRGSEQLDAAADGVSGEWTVESDGRKDPVPVREGVVRSATPRPGPAGMTWRLRASRRRHKQGHAAAETQGSLPSKDPGLVRPLVTHLQHRGSRLR
jgi:hypothetical protein